MDDSERNYSFHLQDKTDNLIIRWDNAPHHSNVATYPHHKHDKEKKVFESTEISISEVIEIILKKITHE